MLDRLLKELKEMADKALTDRGLQLPAPASDPGDPIVVMFQRRQTTRDIDPTPLPMQELSNLLWAAFGVNRKVGPFGMPAGRTAGSASNSQEIDLYVALADGAYRYDAPSCRLAPVMVPLDAKPSSAQTFSLTRGLSPVAISRSMQSVNVRASSIRHREATPLASACPP
jgi:hypothetical protein